MLALCATLLLASPEAAEVTPEPGGRYAQPTGASAREWLVNPQLEEQLAVVGSGGIFLRTAPQTWVPVPAEAVAGWIPAVRGRERLATGRVLPVAVLPSVRVGAVSEGLVEGKSLSGKLQPVPVPVGVRAGALLRDGAALLAGDSEGLFVCPPTGAPCERVASEAFGAVRGFADGTWIAGDEDGDLWRFAPGHPPHRVRAASDRIVGIDGVVDGGPRFAISASGQSFRSEDHGLSWVASPPAEGRLGPGGLLAGLLTDGRLRLGSLTQPLTLDEEAGAFDPAATLYWAGQSALVLASAQQLTVYEPSRIARRVAPFDGRLLDVQAREGRIVLLLAGDAGVSTASLPARAEGLTRSAGAMARAALLWIVPLVGLLGLLGWAWQRRMRRLALPLGLR